MKTKITAVYMRVSTEKQSIDTQKHQVDKFLEYRPFENIQYYQDDAESGTSINRPALNQLLNDVKAGKVETVIVVKLDRLFRSVKHLIETLATFKQHGATFISITENIDLTTAMGVFMMQVLGSFAEFERNMIAHRTKASLDRIRASGRKLGPPVQISTETRNKVIELRNSGLSLRVVAQQTGISHTMVNRIMGEQAFEQIIEKELM